MSDRDDSDLLAGFGSLINAMGGGGDRGNMFPQSDADDLRHGARFIPGEVTDARRKGEVVNFVNSCGPCCWYWEFADGSRVYHFDPLTYSQIGRTNHGDKWSRESGGLAGKCPDCGNEHTIGGFIEAATQTS